MQNQTLKTLDILSVGIVLAVVAVFSFNIVVKTSKKDRNSLAIEAAENISAQLMSTKLKNIQEQFQREARNLASEGASSDNNSTKFSLGAEGIIGKDPWGRPFNYRFLAGENGRFEYLLVWSSGPDGEAKLDYQSLGLAQAALIQGATLQGDDISLVQKTPVRL